MKKYNYFSIHCIQAMSNNNYSVVRANIEYTTGKIQLAQKLYPAENYLLQGHNDKIEMQWVISKN